MTNSPTNLRTFTNTAIIRRWTEAQRTFGHCKWKSPVEEPIEIYEEKGIMIKRYRYIPAAGTGVMANVRSTGRGN